MRRQRITREEVLAVMRANGVVRPEDVAAVVLETDGSVSIMRSHGDVDPGGPTGVLASVDRPSGNA